MRCQLGDVWFLSIKLIFILCISNCKDALLCVLLLLLFGKQTLPWTILSNDLLISWSNYLQCNPWFSRQKMGNPAWIGSKSRLFLGLFAPWLPGMGLVHSNSCAWNGSTGFSRVLSGIHRRLLLSQLSFNLAQIRAVTEVSCRLKPKEKQAG